MSTIRRIDRPQQMAVLLDEAKAYLRIETEAEDPLISRLIESTQIALEDHLNRSLTERTWELVLDRWPVGAIRLPRPPLRSVVSVSVVAADGALQTVPQTDYQVDTRPEPGLLIPKSTASLPLPGRSAGGIVIRFTAGYGASWNDIPEPLRQAMLLLVARHFEQRGPDGVTDMSASVRQLVSPFRVLTI